MKLLKTHTLPCASPEHGYSGQYSTQKIDLGEPLGIHEVACLIGCSVWTVRMRQIPAGLPHFRSSPNGRFVFYRNQVVRWLVKNQIGDTD